MAHFPTFDFWKIQEEKNGFRNIFKTFNFCSFGCTSCRFGWTQKLQHVVYDIFWSRQNCTSGTKVMKNKIGFNLVRFTVFQRRFLNISFAGFELFRKIAVDPIFRRSCHGTQIRLNVVIWPYLSVFAIQDFAEIIGFKFYSRLPTFPQTRHIFLIGPKTDATQRKICRLRRAWGILL